METYVLSYVLVALALALAACTSSAVPKAHTVNAAPKPPTWVCNVTAALPQHFVETLFSLEKTSRPLTATSTGCSASSPTQAATPTGCQTDISRQRAALYVPDLVLPLRLALRPRNAGRVLRPPPNVTQTRNSRSPAPSRVRTTGWRPKWGDLSQLCHTATPQAATPATSSRHGSPGSPTVCHSAAASSATDSPMMIYGSPVRFFVQVATGSSSKSARTMPTESSRSKSWNDERRKRMDRKQTQEAVANELGVKQQRYARWSWTRLTRSGVLRRPPGVARRPFREAHGNARTQPASAIP